MLNISLILLLLLAGTFLINVHCSPCYDHLETIHIRWSIESILNRTNDESLDSPLFPTSNRSETKWFIRMNPKVRRRSSRSSDSEESVSFSNCIAVAPRQPEVTSYRLRMGRDVYSSSPGGYYPDRFSTIPCFRENLIVSMEKFEDYVEENDGKLDLDVEIRRLRELPACLFDLSKYDANNTYLTGTPQEKPEFSDYCVTETTVINTVRYQWNGQLNSSFDRGSGYTLVSPLFQNEDNKAVLQHWVLELQIDQRQNDNIALFLTKVYGDDAFANYYIHIVPVQNGGVKTLSGSNRFDAKTPFWGFDKVMPYGDFLKNYITSTNEFEIHVLISIVNETNACSEEVENLTPSPPVQFHQEPTTTIKNVTQSRDPIPMLREVVSELKTALKRGKDNNEQLQYQIQQFQNQHFQFQHQIMEFQRQQKLLEQKLNFIPTASFPTTVATSSLQSNDLNDVIRELQELLSTEKQTNSELENQIGLFNGEHLEFQKHINMFQKQQEKLQKQLQLVPSANQERPAVTSQEADSKACFKFPNLWKNALPADGENLWILWANVPQMKNEVLQPVGDMLITPQRTISLVDSSVTKSAYSVIKPDNMTSDILWLANSRKLESLKGICQNILTQTITTDNILSILTVADITEASELLDRALDFVFENRDQIETSGLAQLLQSNSNLYLQYTIRQQMICEASGQTNCLELIL